MAKGTGSAGSVGEGGSTVVKTTGKVAATPSGSGTGQVKPAAAKTGHVSGSKVVGVKRTPVPKSAR